jgi:hypothetical protein
MSLPRAALFAFDFFDPLHIQAEVSDAPLTSDAVLLPLRQFDERIGLTNQFAAALGEANAQGTNRRFVVTNRGAIAVFGSDV